MNKQKNLLAQLASPEINEFVEESQSEHIFDVECFICKKTISLLDCGYLGGDPVCKGHLK